jgi:hypothetical protein
MRILDDTAIEVCAAADDPDTLEAFRRVHRQQDNPLQIPLALRTVEYTYQQLLDAMPPVQREARELLAPYGAYISTMGPSVDINRLRITLSRYSQDAAEVLNAKFGEIIFVETTAVTVVPA